ncbi:hypothetical protein, partial [Serratia ureilytica]|uniref:hypothetical protein n=2 Tax=Serratia TaxID=613 RepID=UPI003F7FE801
IPIAKIALPPFTPIALDGGATPCTTPTPESTTRVQKTSGLTSRRIFRPPRQSASGLTGG